MIVCFFPCLGKWLHLTHICPIGLKLLPSWERSHIPTQCMFEDEFPFPKVRYVSSLEGTNWELEFLLVSTPNSSRSGLLPGTIQAMDYQAVGSLEGYQLHSTGWKYILCKSARVEFEEIRSIFYWIIDDSCVYMSVSFSNQIILTFWWRFPERWRVCPFLQGLLWLVEDEMSMAQT